MTDSVTHWGLEYRVLTPTGRGAVGVIEVRGDLDRLTGKFHARNGKPLSSQEINSIRYGDWGPEDVVCIRTAADRVEIHCHGGDAAIQRIVNDLQSSGVGRWTPRESVSTALSELLTRTTTRKTAHHVLNQQRLWPHFLHQLSHLNHDDIIARVDEALRWEEFGRHLVQPWSVVLCGRPNVGKSSLINALVGFERSVVYDQPGTTRDIVGVETAFDGWPVELSDTAGLRLNAKGLEAEGITRAQHKLQSADLVVIVLDACSRPTVEDHDLLSRFPTALAILNKSDIAPNSATSGFDRLDIAVSAKTGSGISELIDTVSKRLVPHDPGFDQLLPVTGNQVEILIQLGEAARMRKDDRIAKLIADNL